MLLRISYKYSTSLLASIASHSLIDPAPNGKDGNDGRKNIKNVKRKSAKMPRIREERQEWA